MDEPQDNMKESRNPKPSLNRRDAFKGAAAAVETRNQRSLSRDEGRRITDVLDRFTGIPLMEKEITYLKR
jgi:hypothetical protein